MSEKNNLTEEYNSSTITDHLPVVFLRAKVQKKIVERKPQKLYARYMNANVYSYSSLEVFPFYKPVIKPLINNGE